jgi:hypothetical protein
MKDCQPAETVGLVCGRVGNKQSNGAVKYSKSSMEPSALMYTIGYGASTL